MRHSTAEIGAWRSKTACQMCFLLASTKILSKMNPADHRYDNIISFFREYPRLGIIRSFRELNLARILHLQAEIDAYQKEYESGAIEVNDGTTNAISLSPIVDRSAQLGSQLDGAQNIWQLLREYSTSTPYIHLDN